MTAETFNTDWNDVPMTDGNAAPIAVRNVSVATVIHIAKASIRDAIIEDAHFELTDPLTAYGTYAGKQRAEVKCLWYGRKPPTSWMHITLLGPHTELRDYSGEVVADIGRPVKT